MNRKKFLFYGRLWGITVGGALVAGLLLALITWLNRGGDVRRMILRVTEGSLAPVDCAEDGSCDRVSTCATAMLWKKISDAVNDVVDHTTLADLLEWQQDKEDYCLQVELNKGSWI